MKRIYILCGTVSLLICCCCLLLFLQPLIAGNDIAPPPEVIDTGAPPTTTPHTVPGNSDEPDDPTPPDNTEPVTGGDPAETDPPDSAPYVCPAELSAIMEENPDAYAWLYVPGIGISYPVMQSADSDLYYLNHNSRKQYSAAGALFTEHSYNSRDFEDPVTIIYGHLMKSNAMFGALQNVYSVPENLESCSVIEVYLPDKKLEYRVFAALPYDNRHILYNYDFSKARIYSTFFDSIMDTRALNVNFAPKYKPVFGDCVLILSTCLRGDSTQRYLVMAKRVESLHSFQ